MIRALYTASSGLVAQSLKQDILANNIANAQTAGFKRERVVTSSFAQVLEEQIGPARMVAKQAYPQSAAQSDVVTAEAALDTTEGPIQVTGNALDFAIHGPGAFEVRGVDGTRLTRAGNFHLNANNELCAADGAIVQGDSGPIRLDSNKWQLEADGTITSEGVNVGKIKVVESTAGETDLRNGCLEGSNVNIVSEMVDMITNMRAFEANQKVIGSVDRTLDKMINEGGKV